MKKLNFSKFQFKYLFTFIFLVVCGLAFWSCNVSDSNRTVKLNVKLKDSLSVEDGKYDTVKINILSPDSKIVLIPNVFVGEVHKNQNGLITDIDLGTNAPENFIVEVNGYKNGIQKLQYTLMVKGNTSDSAILVFIDTTSKLPGGKPPTSIFINHNSPLEISLGSQPLSLSASVLPSDASQGIIWNSGDSSHVMITKDAEGHFLATAVAFGSSILVAKSTVNPSIFATLLVNVTHITVLPESVVIQTLNPLLMTAGSSAVPLSANILPAGADQRVTWTSSDTSKVSIFNGSFALPRATGFATLTAISTTKETVKAMINAQVVAGAIPPTGVLVETPSPLTLTLGAAVTAIKAKVLPLGADQGLNYKSSNPLIAALESGNQLKGLMVGRDTITVSSTIDPTKTSSLIVIVVDSVVNPDSINLAMANPLALVVGDSAKELLASIMPAGANQGLTWISASPTKVAILNGKFAKALDTGETILTVTSNVKPSVLKTLRVISQIKVIKPTSIVLNIPNPLILAENRAEGDLSASILPTGAKQEVVWKSSDTSVVQITGLGKAKPLKKGTATITAYSKQDTLVKTTLSVEVIVPISVSGITITPKALKIYTAGPLGQLTVKMIGNDSGAKYNLSSSAPTVASINATGGVKGLAPGKAVITASVVGYPNVKDSSVVDVLDNGITMLVTPKTATVSIQDSVYLVLSIKNPNQQDVAWSANDGKNPVQTGLTKDSVFSIRLGYKMGATPGIQNIDFGATYGTLVLADQGAISVLQDLPTATLGADTIVKANANFSYQADWNDKLGTIKSVQYKAGSGTWATITSKTISFVAPATPTTVICSLKVTDDDNQTAIATKQIRVLGPSSVIGTRSATNVAFWTWTGTGRAGARFTVVLVKDGEAGTKDSLVQTTLTYQPGISVPLSPGGWRLKVSEEDASGNWGPYGEATVTLTKPGKPVFDYSKTSPRYWGNETMNWVWSAGTDGGAGYELSLDGAPAVKLNALIYTQNGVAGQPYQLSVRTVDGSGIKSDTALCIPILIDLTPPSMAFTTTMESQMTSGNPTIAGTVTDNLGGSGLASLTYSAPGATPSTGTVLVTSSNWTLNSVGFPVGVTTVTFTATDKAGKSSTKDFTLIKNVVFVKKGSGGTGTGVSWSKAYQSVSEAMDSLKMSKYPDYTQIWVTKGDYDYLGLPDVNFSKSNIEVYGGFNDITPESNILARNLSTNITYFSKVNVIINGKDKIKLDGIVFNFSDRTYSYGLTVSNSTNINFLNCSFSMPFSGYKLISVGGSDINFTNCKFTESSYAGLEFYLNPSNKINFTGGYIRGISSGEVLKINGGTSTFSNFTISGNTSFYGYTELFYFTDAKVDFKDGSYIQDSPTSISSSNSTITLNGATLFVP